MEQGLKSVGRISMVQNPKVARAAHIQGGSHEEWVVADEVLFILQLLVKFSRFIY